MECEVCGDIGGVRRLGSVQNRGVHQVHGCGCGVGRQRRDGVVGAKDSGRGSARR